MRIVITGAAGMVGRGVVAYVREQGHEVVACDLASPHDWPADLPLHHVDTRDATALAELFGGADAVVHLAAVRSPGEPPYLVGEKALTTYHTNTISSFAVLHAAHAAGVDRVCLASSINAIGMAFSTAPRFEYVPVDEAHPARPMDEYSLSKAVLELQAEAFARQFPTMRIACLRMSGVYASSRDVTYPHGNAETAAAQDLWTWTSLDLAARACLAACLRTPPGAHTFFVVEEQSTSAVPTAELVAAFYPDAVVRGTLPGTTAAISSAALREVLLD